MESLDTEQVLLGGLMRNNAVYDVVAPFLSATDFASPAHSTLYAACGALIDNSRSADPVTLAQDTLVLEALSGEGMDAGYLVKLFREEPVGKAKDHAILIRDMALRRKLVEIGDGIKMDAERWPVERPIGELFDRIEAELDEVRKIETDEFGAVKLSTVLKASLKEAELAATDRGVLGIKCGISDLDEMIGGFQKSKFYVFAGRPGMGKSVLAANLVTGLQTSVLFFSCEMGSEEVGTRILSSHSQIRAEYQDADRGRWGKAQMGAVRVAMESLAGKEVFIDAHPTPNLIHIDREIRKRLRRGQLGAVIIDHIHRMSPPDWTQGNIRVGLSEIAKGMKSLAKRYRIPVVAFAQLNRTVENRENKRPKLADLKESGTIEEEADIVGFLYRQGYYDKDPDPQQELEITIAKQRAGKTLFRKFHIDLGTARIRNQAHA